MKSRQLNKLYQMIRVSRFYFKHKPQVNDATLKMAFKKYNDKIDDLLVCVLKQNEDITYAAKDVNALREELTLTAIRVCDICCYYFINNDIKDYHSVNLTYTDLKALTKHDLQSRCAKIMETAERYRSELKECGLKEKEIVRYKGLLDKWNTNMAKPRVILAERKYITKKIFEKLNELNLMQRRELDRLCNHHLSLSDAITEYRKARKYINHRNPEGKFEEMLKLYSGIGKSKIFNKASINKDKAVILKLRIQEVVK